MDLQHSKSYAALTQQSSQLFKPKQLSFKQQMAQQPTQTHRLQIQALTTPTMTECDSNPYLNQQLYSFKSYRISTEMINGSPIDQIQLILRENENLKRSLNQKQQIIESLNRSRKVKPRLDFSDFKRTLDLLFNRKVSRNPSNRRMLKQNSPSLKIIINALNCQNRGFHTNQGG